ncbi:unnamed protein product [Polarella glacialis]|uniref:Uncharacterized protein n=1 Tax=Polarella glacialis TaxID=89957 RepID=A0A813DIF6_POLGL|nr:unnamed protein product [Polarella glacialis]CAE8672997.1 unnamed protein product [Polarella glacialis]|mmetsp:Transcript_82282/g.148503  ORF Transcript_82282/g.148503 Transcript_82282/m.148503 type:complete len:297 (+) Transcript_82282:67-957(+)
MGVTACVCSASTLCGKDPQQEGAAGVAGDQPQTYDSRYDAFDLEQEIFEKDFFSSWLDPSIAARQQASSPVMLDGVAPIAFSTGSRIRPFPIDDDEPDIQSEGGSKKSTPVAKEARSYIPDLSDTAREWREDLYVSEVPGSSSTTAGAVSQIGLAEGSLAGQKAIAIADASGAADAAGAETLATVASAASFFTIEMPSLVAAGAESSGMTEPTVADKLHLHHISAYTGEESDEELTAVRSAPVSGGESSGLGVQTRQDQQTMPRVRTADASGTTSKRCRVRSTSRQRNEAEQLLLW